MARPRILVIEDDPLWTSLLDDWLRPHYALSWAAEGAAGLAQIAAAPPDAVILDLHMAGLDGVEVLTRLRAGGAGRQLPVVVFSSAVTDGPLRRRLAAIGGSGPLVLAPKGAKMDTLLAALRQVLDEPSAVSYQPSAREPLN